MASSIASLSLNATLLFGIRMPADIDGGGVVVIYSAIAVAEGIMDMRLCDGAGVIATSKLPHRHTQGTFNLLSGVQLAQANGNKHT